MSFIYTFWRLHFRHLISNENVLRHHAIDTRKEGRLSRRLAVSVILPFQDAAQTIAGQLRALARQDWPAGSELIAVDAGSRDGSWDIVAAHSSQFPRVRILRAQLPAGQARGLAHACNAGVDAATGHALCFCSAEDEVGTGWLAGMARALAEHALVSGPLEYTHLNEAWLVAACNHGHWRQSHGLMRDELGLPPHLPFAMGCNLGMHRHVYEAAGPFDRQAASAWDADFCWRAQLRGIPLQYINDVQVHHRLHHRQRLKFQLARHAGRDRMYLLGRYSNAPQSRYHLTREFLALIPYFAKGLKLFLMKSPDIRRGKGAWVLWCGGAGFRLGYLESQLRQRFRRAATAAAATSGR